MKQKINSPFICTYTITAGRVDWLNRDKQTNKQKTSKQTNKNKQTNKKQTNKQKTNKQTNKQTVLNAPSHFLSTNTNGLHFITAVSTFSSP